MHLSPRLSPPTVHCVRDRRCREERDPMNECTCLTQHDASLPHYVQCVDSPRTLGPAAAAARTGPTPKPRCAPHGSSTGVLQGQRFRVKTPTHHGFRITSCDPGQAIGMMPIGGRRRGELSTASRGVRRVRCQLGGGHGALVPRPPDNKLSQPPTPYPATSPKPSPQSTHPQECTKLSQLGLDCPGHENQRHKHFSAVARLRKLARRRTQRLSPLPPLVHHQKVIGREP